MNFEELSDEEWMQVSSLVSDEPPGRLNRRGRPRAEPRVVANAVLWILTTGEAWSRLPARYPSGPTCRRRFEEWHARGTLIELVELLSQCGRKFVCVPQPVQPGAAPVAVIVEEAAEDDGLPAVYWKSPEAWQTPTALADAPLADPMESMMRQLTRSEPAAPGLSAEPADHVAPPARATRFPTPFAPSRAGKPTATCAMPREEHATTHRRAHAPGDAVQVAEWRGYTMSLTVQPVRNRTFRGVVEILKDGKRVERSGLIGPPFQDREAARNFAFDWARDWIDRDGAAEAASGAGFPVSPRAKHSASQGVAQSGAQAPLPRAVANAPVQSASVTRGDPSNAAIARVLPCAVPDSVRLAPMQRYTATGAPAVPGSEARDANAATSGTAERPATGTTGTRYRTLSS